MDTAATISSGISPNRFRELDFIRGILAIAVVMYHNGLSPKVQGGFCVSVFFILSGFVMSYAYGKKIKNGAMGIMDFALLRLGRLYPLIFIGSIMSILIGFLLWVRMPDLNSIFLNLFLLQGIGTNFGFIPAFWSIGVEFWVGLTLFYGILRYKAYFINFLIVLALLFFAYGGKDSLFFGIDVGAINSRIRSGLFGVGAGVIIYQIYFYFTHYKLDNLTKKSLTFMFYLLFVTMIMYIFGSKSIAVFKVKEIYALILASAMILLGALLKNQCKLFCAKWQSWLGDISYSVYVYHFLAIWIIRSMIDMNNNDMFNIVCGHLAVIAIVLIVSHYSSKYIEKPAYKWFRAKIGR
ncbi:MAG: acyltransferase [Helicobacteraceae bacterium]|nr:acyltransferase [Helicobacteraceae bacterium]